jgi:hypothetical protein
MDLKDLGAIVGSMSAALFLYDRYHKGRPIASLTTIKGDGDQNRVCIRVTNTTAYDVAIIGGVPSSEIGVRRAKAALSSGCKSHPATAPAGSNRSSHGGNEVAEAFD